LGRGKAKKEPKEARLPGYIGGRHPFIEGRKQTAGNYIVRNQATKDQAGEDEAPEGGRKKKMGGESWEKVTGSRRESGESRRLRWNWSRARGAWRGEDTETNLLEAKGKHERGLSEKGKSHSRDALILNAVE